MILGFKAKCQLPSDKTFWICQEIVSLRIFMSIVFRQTFLDLPGNSDPRIVMSIVFRQTFLDLPGKGYSICYNSNWQMYYLSNYTASLLLMVRMNSFRVQFSNQTISERAFFLFFSASIGHILTMAFLIHDPFLSQRLKIELISIIKVQVNQENVHETTREIKRKKHERSRQKRNQESSTHFF